MAAHGPLAAGFSRLEPGRARFADITNKRIRRGAFSSVREFTDATDHWVEHWNDNPQPFV